MPRYQQLLARDDMFNAAFQWENAGRLVRRMPLHPPPSSVTSSPSQECSVRSGLHSLTPNAWLLDGQANGGVTIAGLPAHLEVRIRRTIMGTHVILF
jgi:hypothetical protein